MTAPRWLFVSEVAAYTRMDPRTVRIAIRDGRLRATQLVEHGRYRVHVDDLQAWLHGRRPPARRSVA